MRVLHTKVNQFEYRRIVRSLNNGETVYSFLKTAIHNELVSRGA